MHLMGSVLSETDQERNFGVLVDDSMKVLAHWAAVVKKAHTALGKAVQGGGEILLGKPSGPSCTRNLFKIMKIVEYNIRVSGVDSD